MLVTYTEFFKVKHFYLIFSSCNYETKLKLMTRLHLKKISCHYFFGYYFAIVYKMCFPSKPNYLVTPFFLLMLDSQSTLNLVFFLSSENGLGYYTPIGFYLVASALILQFNFWPGYNSSVSILITRDKVLTSIAPKRLALSPILSSMYLRSSSVIVGCFAGLSYDTKSQNMYQTMPKLPVEYIKKRRI